MTLPVTGAWLHIDELPDDYERPGGQRYWLMKDRDEKEFVAKRGYFNNSGFSEKGTNREVWPVYYDPNTGEPSR